MGYEILHHTEKDELEKMVRNYLERGWSLQGGIAVGVKNGNSEAYFQAVTKN